MSMAAIILYALGGVPAIMVTDLCYRLETGGKSWTLGESEPPIMAFALSFFLWPVIAALIAFACAILWLVRAFKPGQ